MNVTNAHSKFHYHSTGPFMTHPDPIEELPKPEFPEKRFSKLSGDTVTFSEAATSLAAAIGKESTYGLWPGG